MAAAHGLDPAAFVQDSQSRSGHGTLRGLHGRGGAGEAKLVRCARGAILDVIVDARPGSPTYGRHQAFRLDDEQFRMLYVPRGFLHGFQVLSEVADICYRIDRPHDPTEDLSVRYDDPDLGIAWPLPVDTLSPRDQSAGSWRDLTSRACPPLTRTAAGAAGRPSGEVVLDLGDQPAADHFPLASDPGPDPRHPLAMWWCADCGLAQLRDDAHGSRRATCDRAPRRRQAGPRGRRRAPRTPVCSHPGSSSSSRARTAAPGARRCWPGLPSGAGPAGRASSSTSTG